MPPPIYPNTKDVPAFVADFKGQHDVIQKQKELFEEGNIQKNGRDAELDRDTGQRGGILDALSVLADEPGDPGEHDEAEQTLYKHEELLMTRSDVRFRRLCHARGQFSIKMRGCCKRRDRR